MFSLRSRRPAAVAAAALVACAIAPAAAHAESIAYIFEHDVWLTSPDGQVRHRVTSDGTATDPYRSPSQADDGTIAVGKGQEILRMRQNGEVLNRIDPEPLKNSAGQPVDGPPVQVAISPDGARIAYTLVGYSCPVAAECMARGVTAYTAADHFTPAAEGGVVFRWQPSWVTSSRTLVFGGYLGQVNVHDVGQPAEVHWFDDQDMAADSTDLNDGEVNRQGTKLALIRGYAGNQFGHRPRIVSYTVNGNIQAGSPPKLPSPQCMTSEDDGLHGPSWAPDGVQLVFGTSAGIEILPDPLDCAAASRVLVAGGSQPDWGPAAIAPPPPSGGTGGGSGGGTAGGSGGGGTGGGGAGGGAAGGGTPSSSRPTLQLARPGSPSRVAAKGLRATVSCPAACRLSVRLTVDKATGRRLRLGASRVLGTASARLAKAGTRTLTLRPAAKHRKRFKRLARVTVTVRITATGYGKAQTVTRTVTVRR